MDLNQLYQRHQILLMRASSASSNNACRNHKSEAAGIARRIEAFQNALGALAAQSWRPEMVR
ncbi:hypothetical protein [Novosphingobium nitrogenifigens]|uniref:hypothetical protein n=1 Tax=Novosphingobium nitrogenifigens TaxID=378548 RepID=UPI0002EE6A4B|nr:hypothetical protein [Novosphingobium nitrogenifigens]